MSGTIGDLSPKQGKNLEQFKECLKDVMKPEFDDHYLLRWLRARNFDVQKSESMLRTHLAWRKKMAVDTIQEDFVFPEVLEKYYVGGWFGQDKEGSFVWYDPTGHLDIRGILRSSKKMDIIKMKVCLVEAMVKKLAEESIKRGKRVDQIFVVFDLNKFGMKHLWKPGLDVFCELITVLEDNYPELLKICFVINAPRIFPIVYKIVKPFLTEATVQKIHVFGSHYQEQLQKHVDPDKIPEYYGGTCRDPDGDPRCLKEICFGGAVPEKYYCQNIAETKNLIEVSVGRGSTLQLEYDLKVANSVIRWQFVTDGYDIGFGIFKRTGKGRQKAGDMESVLDSQRVNSHMVPEDGSITCKEAGVYVVRFDNTYSWTTSKKVRYLIEILEPDIGDDISLPSTPSSDDISFTSAEQSL